MLRPAPSLAYAIDLIPMHAQTPEEDDLAVAVQWIHMTHRGSPIADSSGGYGCCSECDVPWPCPKYMQMDTLVLEWLIMASTRHMRGMK